MFRKLAICLFVIMTGCAPITAHQPGDIWDPVTRNLVNDTELKKQISDADIILVGETHNNPYHHLIQLKILKLAHQTARKNLLIGIEWLDTSFKEVCQNFSQGKITEKQFTESVNWSRNWGFPFELYSPIFQFIQQKKITLIPLNAPISIVRQISRNGLSSLSSTQRKKIALSLNLKDRALRDQLTKQFTFHSFFTNKSKDNFVAAQIVRDETMAATLSERLLPWPDTEKKAIIFAGKGHMTSGQGLKPRLLRRLPNARILTVLPVNIGTKIAGMEHNNTESEIYIYSKRSKKHRPRLGLLLEPSALGLVVKKVMPKSIADEKGIKAQDILKTVNGKKVFHPKDIHSQISSAPQKTHEYGFDRDGKTFSVFINLMAKEK